MSGEHGAQDEQEGGAGGGGAQGESSYLDRISPGHCPRSEYSGGPTST